MRDWRRWGVRNIPLPALDHRAVCSQRIFHRKTKETRRSCEEIGTRDLDTDSCDKDDEAENPFSGLVTFMRRGGTTGSHSVFKNNAF